MISTTTTPLSVIATIAVGSFPNGVAVGPAGNRVYVANTASGNVSVIDNTITPPAVISSIGLGDIGPFGVAVTPDGKRLYVANFGSGTVSVLDLTKPPRRGS